MSRLYRSTFRYEGKRYERTSSISQREADRKADKLLSELKNGTYGISGKMTVKRWAHEWLETYKKASVGEGQYRNYLAHIDGVIIPAIGKLMLKEVKDIHLQKILNGRAGNSKSDVSRLRMTMKAMFGRAHQSRMILYNPAENLELPSAEDGTHRSITPDERERILKLAETHHAGLWVKTLLYTGMRPGETRALDWRHVDLNKRVIHVERAMKASTNEIGAPKSASGVRDIPIPDKLYSALAEVQGEPFEPVFKQALAGVRHTKQSMGRLWNNFKREMDISMGAKLYRSKIVMSLVAPDLVPYCLRHTYCTDLQDAGVPINVARYLMGHANIAMTAKIYTHTTEKALNDAVEKINAMLNEAV